MKKKSSSSCRQKKPVPTIRAETYALPAIEPFPIVGIGASAGGSKPWISSWGECRQAAVTMWLWEHFEKTILATSKQR
jgi:hypothetical protein